MAAQYYNFLLIFSYLFQIYIGLIDFYRRVPPNFASLCPGLPCMTTHICIQQTNEKVLPGKLFPGYLAKPTLVNTHLMNSDPINPSHFSDLSN